MRPYNRVFFWIMLIVSPYFLYLDIRDKRTFNIMIDIVLIIGFIYAVWTNRKRK